MPPASTAFVLDQATLWIGDGQSVAAHVIVRDGILESVAPGRYTGDLPRIALGGAAVSPGLVDIMLCGGFNLSLLHDDPVAIARHYLSLGVTTCQITTGTLTDDHMVQFCEKAAVAMAYEGLDASWITGVYFEGPFYDPACIGGNNAELV